MNGGYGPSRKDAEGTRLAPLMNGVCAVVVAGSEPATAVAVAVGAARVQCATRRVAVADLVGDAPLILRLLPDDDPHGISDSFLYGVSFNKIARPVEGEDQLFVIPSGSEPVTTEAIYASDRWRRLSAGFHQVGALLVVVARPEVPGFGALCTHVGAVLPVGEVPVALPEGVVVLRPEPEPPPAPTAPTPLEALLAKSAAADREPTGAQQVRAPEGDSRGGTAFEKEDPSRAPRLGLRVDAQGIVRPGASRAPADDEVDDERVASPWWRAPRTLVLAAVVLAGITLGALNPGWIGTVAASLTAARTRLAGERDTLARADSARVAAAVTGAPTVVPTDTASLLGEPADSAIGDTAAVDPGLPQAAAGAPETPRPDSAPRPVPPPPVVSPPKQVAPPTVPTLPTRTPAAAAIPPAAQSPAQAPTPSAAPARSAPPPPARAALTVANPDDAARAARYAIYVATSNTREGALPDPRLRGADATALSPVTDGGTRWYRLTVGAEATRADATALLARLRAQDPTVSGSIVALPYAFLVERGVAAAQVPARLTALASRGIFAYALRQGDGTGAIYTGAFESPEQARTLADSLRAVGMAPTLVYRTGRGF
jgi:outer membrane biosynthesis protein TonB